MPSSAGMRMSNRHTSGRSRRASSTASPPVGGLADDLDARLGVEDHREPGADDLLVVGDEHPDAHAGRPGPGQHGGHGPAAVRVRAGLAGAAEQVGALGHADEPVTRRAAGRPALASPSSLTRRRTDVSSAATRTSMRVACRACRRALVTDSWASR